MRLVVVELESGDQEYFDSTYDAFTYAKQMESIRPHSVDYVAIGDFESDDDHIVWRGQELRLMIRSLDNIIGWLRAGYDQVHTLDEREQ